MPRPTSKNQPQQRGKGAAATIPNWRGGDATATDESRTPVARRAPAAGPRAAQAERTPGTQVKVLFGSSPLQRDTDQSTRFDTSGPAPTVAAREPEVAKPRGTPLWGAWELWCDLPQPRGAKPTASVGWTWIDDVKSIGVFDTVQGFWGLHHCLKDLPDLDVGTNLYLLRRNVPPMWEHEANRRGGRWSVVLPASEAAVAHDVWLAVRLAAIGETFPGDDSDICGVTCSRKRHAFRISVWTRYANDEATQRAIGDHFRAICSTLPASVPLQYTVHAASLSGSSPLSRGRSPPLGGEWPAVTLDAACSRSRSLSPTQSIPSPLIAATPTNSGRSPLTRSPPTAAFQLPRGCLYAA